MKPETASHKTIGGRITTALLCMALIVMTATVFMNAGNHGFLDYDDTTYVTENPHVSSGITGKNIAWAFTSFEASNWHPVTWLSHMADVQIYGLNPRGHHLTSVAMHAISSVLLLLFLFRFTGSLWRSFFVAALFALHPLRVESVAWVAERKDVLSAFFWILTLYLYACYVVQRTPALYLLAFFAFVFGLMSKPMLVTLPLVMLLMDFWPLDRSRRHGTDNPADRLKGRVVEKIPFFACSLLSGAVTIYAQQKGGATRSLEELPFLFRAENGLVAAVTYLIKTLVPQNLALPYPMPSSFPLWQPIGSLLVLLLVSAAAVRFGRRFPYLPVGWFWYLITLLPVIGLIQVGGQAMADRYTYIPGIGLLIVAGWGVPELLKNFRYRRVALPLLAGGSILAAAVLSWHQLGYWRDGTSLFRHTLLATGSNYLAHFNLGIALSNKGDQEAAMGEYREALRIAPHIAEAHYNLGNELARAGNLAAAVLEYRETLRINPNHAKAHNNLGAQLSRENNLDGALQEYRTALRINPDFSEAHSNAGYALARKGDLDAAIREHREALRIDPHNPKLLGNLGIAFAQKGNPDAAVQQFREALKINPNSSEAHNNLGYALAGAGDLDGALREYREALRINPNDARARNNLERALAQKMGTHSGTR